MLSLPALSQPSAPVRLRFERERGLEGCPAEARLRDEVKERLGYEPFAAAAEREVWVRFSRGSKNTVVARIALSKRGVPGGTRELRSSRARCDELFEAVALSLSIAVDPLYGIRAPTPAEAPALGTANETTPSATARSTTTPGRIRLQPREPAAAAEALPRRVIASEWQPPPAPLVDDTSRLLFEIGTGAVVGLGAGPGSVVAGSLTVGARSGLLSLHLEGFAEAPGEVSVDEDARISGGVYGVAFQPCLRLWAGHLLMGRAAWAGGCGVAAAGGFVAGSQGLARARLVVAPWVGLGGRATLDVALLRWLSLRLAGDIIAPVTRINLTDETSGASLWTSPLVSARGGLLLVAFFP